ncbi:MAG: hypothetical protein U0984_19585 [Prosthecobacter sp.]|nr:hypothetical protein [Prosthecobacter sp.]
MKTLALWRMRTALLAAGQLAARVYEDKTGSAATAFRDAEKAGSALHKRMGEIERELERKQDPLASSPTKRIIIAVRAAAEFK